MILYEKIENKLENVGQDDMYPTQIVIDTKDLEKIDEEHYLHVPSGIVLSKYGYRLIAEINGFKYVSLHSYEDYEYDKHYKREFYDNQILCRKDKVGFYIYEIKDNTLDEGVYIGDGLKQKEVNPDSLGFWSYVLMECELAKYISRGPIGYAISSYTKKLTRK